ncbi:MAG: hypothetical protein JRJ87_24165 [Deltaproteobacteria bacterium]|nr:hypothetical protein [Deltaproteobacteria bacterium]
MKKTIILASLLAFFLTAIVSQTADAQSLTIMVRPDKKSREFKMSKMITDVINYRLMKAKVDAWEFLSAKAVADLNAMPAKSGDSAAELAAIPTKPDIYVEFKLVESNSATQVTVSISICEQLRNKLLFAKLALSTPRDLKKPGERNRALMDAVEKALPSIVEHLKEYTQDLAKNGGWYRITVENAPAGLMKKLQTRLNEFCGKAEQVEDNLRVYAQCMQADFEVAGAIVKVFEAQAPKAEYDLTEKNGRKIAFKFKK